LETNINRLVKPFASLGIINEQIEEETKVEGD